MRILIVESPAKAKTITKYLNNEYMVLASFGHIRDLPSKSGSVDTKHDFDMLWEVSNTGKTFVKKLSGMLDESAELFLATDPDREGEAIAWHIIELLSDKIKKYKIPVKRVVFHEITKKAVSEAVNNPRNIDQNLVDAYLTRRALDYLFGFTLSPVLWRKLPGCKSAGRVQSVALRIITDRENEIDHFQTQEYWSICAECATKKKEQFTAKLFCLNGEKLEKFSLPSEKTALDAKELISKSVFSVLSVDRKKIKRNPYPPFITSTLQQEASKQLGFSTKKTMQLAQRLYEGIDISGETKALITYMRTDSVHLSDQAVDSIRDFLKNNYGDKFLPKTANKYKNKVKNAQEAHEAIRPIDVTITPESIAGKVDNDLYKLYKLVWRRTVASQMTPAEYDQVQSEIFDELKKHGLRAVGTTMTFEGYKKLYEEVIEDNQSDKDDTQKLPNLEVGDSIDIQNIICDQHFTQPPPRYTEASLVKKMEEIGIGRPSTYATIIQVLQSRKYVVLEKKVFHPEFRGRIVTSFLLRYFPRYLEYNFTADMEEYLDEISNKERSKNEILNGFWEKFSVDTSEVKKIPMVEALEKVNDDIINNMFPDSKEDSKICPLCKTGHKVLKIWSTSVYIGCSNYPECTYKDNMNGFSSTDNEGVAQEYPKLLGTSPDGREVYIKLGPYGLYVEQKGDGKDVKRASIKAIPTEKITLENCLFLLSLPKVIGAKDGEPISIGIGRFGPYILHLGKFTSVKDYDTFLQLDEEQAVSLLNKKKVVKKKAK